MSFFVATGVRRPRQPTQAGPRVQTLQPLESRLHLAAQPYDWDEVTIKANGFVNGIVYSPAAPNVFFIHTDMGGAYRWDQSANQWQSMIDWAQWDDWSPQNMGVETLAVDPTDPDRVYMGVGTYLSPTAIMRSTDGGRTWLRTNVSFNSNGNGSARNAGQRMMVDPNSPNIIFYGTRNDGLWKSTDYGSTWSVVSSFPSTGETSGFAADTGIVWILFDKTSATPGNPTQTLYAGVVNVDAGDTRIYRSTDGGATWTALPGGQPTAANYFPQRAAITPDGNGLYLTYGYSTSYPGPYGITAGMVYKVVNPDDPSPTWVNITPPGVGTAWGFSGVALDPTNPSRVYVTELNNYNPADRIWRSNNGGSTWDPAITPNSYRDNSSAPYVNSLNVHWMGDLQIDPFNNNVAMFTTGMGIYRTSNLTAAQPNWTFFNENFEQSAVLELSSPNTGSVNLLSAIGDRDGFRHVDFAQSPAIGRHGQNNGLASGTCDDIDTAWDDANYVVRTVRSSPYVQYSLDNGVTWQWMPSTNSSGSGSGGNWVAISADGTRIVYEPGGTGRIRWSSRSGSTWSSWTINSSASTRPSNGAQVVAEQVAGSQTFYAHLDASIWRSTDGGASWTLMTSSAPAGPSGFNEWMRAVPGESGHLVRSCGSNGLWRSTDGGATWTRLASATVTTANHVALGAGPAPGSYPAIFVSGTVGGQKGFFRSDDQGSTWIQINDLAHNYGYVTVIQGDPRVYGRLYVGTNGRGIQYADIHDSTPPSLPSGWASSDIGIVNTAGDAGESAGMWEVVGGGAGVGGVSDEFHFAYRQMTGDCVVTAQVMSVPNGGPTNYNAKAGVMIRGSLGANSASAFVALTPGSVNGALFQTRATAGGNTTTVGSVTAGVWPPYWVRLVRSGNQFTAYISPNGNSWTQVGSPQNIPMGATAYVGLAATASDDNQVLISQFQNVSVLPLDATPPQVLSATYHYNSAPNYLSFTFSEDVSASLSTADIVVNMVGGGSVTPTGYSYDSGSNTATFTLPTPLTDGNYRATLIAAGITDAAGNPLAADYVFSDNFFILGGDADHDRDVDNSDFGVFFAHFGQSGGATWSNGDFDYDGDVDNADFGIFFAHFNSTLPQPAPVVQVQASAQPTDASANASRTWEMKAKPAARAARRRSVVWLDL